MKKRNMEKKEERWFLRLDSTSRVRFLCFGVILLGDFEYPLFFDFEFNIIHYFSMPDSSFRSIWAAIQPFEKS